MNRISIVIACCVFAINNSLKAEVNDTNTNKPFYLFNAQIRSDKNVLFEYQAAYIRPNRISFSLKLSMYNYSDELMDAMMINYSKNIFNQSYMTNKVKGQTFKIGVIYPMTYTKHTLSYVGIGGVITNINNKLEAFNQNLYSNSNTLLGAEMEVAGILFFAKRCHIGGLVDIGYKQMNIYKIDEIIKDYPNKQIYAPAQGYSPLPYYVSFSVLLGLKF